MNDPGSRILVVDDEASVRKLLRTYLSSKGYEIQEATAGIEAVEAARTFRPDLILLDLGLPDLDGKEVVRIVREWSATPIIVLSVRGQESEKVECLDIGADDYLTKPFGLSELEARMRNALRHAVRSQSSPEFVSGSLRVDLSAREVTVDGKPCLLTPTEYDLLRCFVSQAGKVLTHRHLMRQVWGYREADDLHILRVNISNLRRKLEANPTRPVHLTTEPGVGYRLRVEQPPQL